MKVGLSTVRGQYAVARRKQASAVASEVSLHAVLLNGEERARRYVRRAVVVSTPENERKRVKALMRMEPPTPGEAAQLVAQFLAQRAPTPCPTRACAEIQNGDGFA